MTSTPYTDSDVYTGELIAGLMATVELREIRIEVSPLTTAKIAAMSDEELRRMGCL